MSKWLRDILLIPILVGLIVAFVQFGLPYLFSQDKELSFELSGPINQIGYDIDKNSTRIELKVNGEAVKSLYSYSIEIQNTGDVPLKKLPVKIVFSNTPNDFKIIGESHRTKPEHEFGKIKPDKKDSVSSRFVYELLNKGDSDEVVLLTNSKGDINLYAKQENLTVKEVEPNKSSKWYIIVIIAMVSSLFSVIASTKEVSPRIMRILLKITGVNMANSSDAKSRAAD